jgi:predicted nucleotidyltransferase
MAAIDFDSTLKTCLADVFSRHPVALAYLFGSAATGRTTPLSDIDIALVLFEGQIDDKDRLMFELEVEDELAGRCGISNADVHVINKAPVAIRGEVVTEGVLLFSRDEEMRVEFETRTRSEYFDFLPAIKFIRESYFDHLRERGFNG